LEAPGAGTEQTGVDSTAQATVDLSLLKSSQMVGDRFYEMNGPVQFSYVPPVGWTIHPSVQSGLATLLGPKQSEGVMMTMMFTITTDDRTAEDFTQGFMAQLSENQIDITTLEEGVYSTQAGGDAYRIKFQAITPTDTAVIEYFVFTNSGFVITAGYSRLANEDPEQDTIIEESMATLRFEQ